jgi:transcriptional regulator of acetoin/glycerol metabolism
MCSDLVETPSLAAQLADAPDALPDLVRYMAIRHAGEEAEGIAGDAIDWVRAHLGPNYSWPGNYRELEQFVRNFIIRRDYRPARQAAPAAADDLFAPARECLLTADELLTRYCTLVYSRSGSYEAAAKLLGLDRRTVKAKVDERLLAGLRGSAPRPRAILG